MSKPLCAASTDATFSFLAECTREKGHLGHHHDANHDASWPGMGVVPAGSPAPDNRAERRGNFIHPKRGRGGHQPRARKER